MTRRILTIILAIVLAVIGTTAVLLYVRGADQRALAGQKAVSVLVATQQIPAGTTARTAQADGWLATQKFPASSVPSDAVPSVTPNLAGLVFTSDLAAGQLLLSPMLGTMQAASTGLPIPSGMVAVTFQFCLPNAVANYVRAGSQIAVFNTFTSPTPGGSSSSGGGGGGTCSTSGTKLSTIHARLVLDKVLVLAVGPAPVAGGATTTGFSQGSNNSPASGPVLITMALDQADAERMIELSDAGVPYLALETTSSKTAANSAFTKP